MQKNPDEPHASFRGKPEYYLARAAITVPGSTDWVACTVETASQFGGEQSRPLAGLVSSEGREGRICSPSLPLACRWPSTL